MSVVLGMERKDLIGATIVEVDGYDVDGCMFDFKTMTVKLVNGETVRIEADRFEEGYLDIDKMVI